MSDIERDKPEATSQDRRTFLKSGVVTGVALTGPILGVSSDEVEAAGKAIAQAAQPTQQGVGSVIPTGLAYGGSFIGGLNRAFAYSSLYTNGAVNKDPKSTIGKFLDKYPAPRSYDKSKFGEFADLILEASDWIDSAGRPIDKGKYKMTDAPGIFETLRHRFCEILDPNLRSDNPKPVFLFVGPSSKRKLADPLKQDGYRFITTTAMILDETNTEREHIVMGILCPPDAP